jgi:hypothetical protein
MLPHHFRIFRFSQKYNEIEIDKSNKSEMTEEIVNCNECFDERAKQVSENNMFESDTFDFMSESISLDENNEK